MFEPIDTRQFMQIVEPALRAGNPVALAKAVNVRWRPREICKLLDSHDIDARRVAAIVLGLVGDLSVTGCLGRALHDEDIQVNEMAQHALWSIWFRACRPEAAGAFREGVDLMADEQYAGAIERFQEAAAIDPEFGEAHNQCAFAHYYLSQWDAAIDECRKAIRLVPTHFGAISGMGHCYTQMGDLRHALKCYRRALEINPRMPVIARAISRLEDRFANDSSSSGGYLTSGMR